MEDEIFYQYIKDWPVYVEYLNDILQAERDYGIAEKELKKWHLLLQQYFQQKPDNCAVTNYTIEIGLTEEVAYEINKNISIMRDNQKIIDIVNNLYRNFDSLIK